MFPKGGQVVLVCLCLAGCSQRGVAEASPSPVKASVPAVSPISVYPGAALGPAPTSCSRPTPRSVNPNFGLAIGDSPVYAVGAWDSTGVLHAERATQTQYGEQVKVLWIIRPGFNSPVTLHGASKATGLPLYFEIDGAGSTTTSPTLDPNLNPGTPWPNWPSYLDIPAADCYFVEADWSGGRWRVEFPAGD
jgi:hypothetical protein